MGSAATNPGPGTLVGGRYELIEIAGRGGMAYVWRAHLRGDCGFQRTVAIKQIHENLATQQAYVDMFVEEARVGAELLSPNIAQAFDFVAEGGNYYLVMEWVEGVDLGTWVRYLTERGERTRWELVVAIGIGLLRGLCAAHERRNGFGEPAPIVHRDVSPHNILLTTKGMVKLIDFGLSLARDRTRDLTEPGIVKGKMSYLSPEIVAGGRPSPYSDQFATASVLWETLVGRKLFDGSTDYEVYGKLRDNQVQPLRPHRPDVPARLVSILNRAQSARPEQRYPNTREMARELAGVLRKARAPRDLHAMLSRQVTDARAALHLGGRTGDPTSQTPIEDLAENMTPVPEQNERLGLRHRLPFFGRRR